MESKDLIRDAIKELSNNERMDENSIRQKIALAVSLSLKSKDTKLQNFWTIIPCKGETPTIDEITDYIIMELAKEQNTTPDS